MSAKVNARQEANSRDLCKETTCRSFYSKFTGRIRVLQLCSMVKANIDVLVQRRLRAMAHTRAQKAELKAIWKTRARNIKKSRKKVSSANQKLRDAGYEGELSEVSSVSSLTSSSSSGSMSESEHSLDKDTPSPKDKAKSKAPAPVPKGKGLAAPSSIPKGKGPVSPPPPPKRKGLVSPAAKNAGPAVPKAPSQNRKANEAGEFYPGFPREDPRFCFACDQLLRGMERAGSKHNTDCEWRIRKVPAKKAAA